MLSWSRFRIFATVLWVLVAALLAFNIVVFFYWPIRWVVFIAAVTVGSVLLISVNWPSRPVRETPEPKQLPSGERPLLTSAGPNKSIPAADQEKKDKLSPKEAQEWLDDFLIKQQTKK